MERVADRVVVPDVVGMPFHVGRDLARDAGVTLANPDPDGPPIGALAWPGLFYITSQRPTAGTEVYRWTRSSSKSSRMVMVMRPRALRTRTDRPWTVRTHTRSSIPALT